jgi:eukaryotic-like serine/threonine-protein kinase
MPELLLQNRYRVLESLGKGAFGEVWRGHDDKLERDVAVKMIDAKLLDSESRARFDHEARAAAALNHPNIVAMYDTGEHEGRPFLVMELVHGKSLRETGPLSLAELRDIALQLCDALAHAHALGIVHRDLKPENVLIAEGPTVKLADLGIALTRKGTRMTYEGAIVGTAAYLAPEQALGGELDARTDLYALGVILYERVAGRPPFAGDDPLAVISQHLHAPIVPPRTYRADLPPAFEAIVLRLLAKSPADRFASANETAAALREAALSPASEGVAVPGQTDGLVVLEQLARGRLIGRRTELQQLRELWVRARRGNGHLALVSGEPGVGKTRLANEAIVYAQLNGATVLKGGSYEYEATTPYLPFVEALRSWVRGQEPAALRARLGAGASELARFAPEIETKLGPLPPSSPLPPHEERLRLFDHVARLFQSLADEGGLLLFLDDLHWADHGSLTLLHYLLRNLRTAPWLAVATYREVELGRDHALAASLVEWNRERLATRVSLGRFDLSETSALLATLFGQESVSADFAAVVHRETEGNPFFIEEVVKSLIERGQIYREGGEWQRRGVQELEIPQSIKSAVGRRLEQLSAPCLEVMHAASALGKTFAFADLSQTVGGEENALLDALDEACTAQLMRPMEGERFAFTHDKIREVLYEELNPIRRRRLHTRIGEALERLYAADIETHAQDLAHHFAEGGQLEKGLDYSLRAADRAMMVFATTEALTHLRRARECADALSRHDRLIEIDERIGDVCNIRGEFTAATDAFERVLAGDAAAATRSRMRAKIGDVLTRLSDPRAMDILDAALAELDPASQANERAQVLGNIGRLHHYKGQHRTAIEFLKRGLAEAEPLDDPDTLTTIYGYLAGAYQHLPRLEESMAWARRSIDMGERLHNPVAIATGNEFMAEDLSFVGRSLEALDYAERNRALAKRIGSVDRLSWTALPIAIVRYNYGELHRALEEAQVGLDLFARTRDIRGTIFLYRMRAWAFTDLGRFEEARASADEAAKGAAPFQQIMLRSEALHAAGYLEMRTGNFARAMEIGRAIEALPLGTDHRALLLALYQWFAAACFASGDLAEATRLCELGSEFYRENGHRHYYALILMTEGDLAAQAGERDLARTKYDEGIEILAHESAKLFEARVRVRRAALLRPIGDLAGAAEDEARATRAFEECGAAPDLAKLSAPAK